MADTDVTAGLDGSAVTADTGVCRAPCRVAIAAQDFRAQLEVEIRRRLPAELQSIINILTAQKSLIDQSLAGKIPGMGVLVVKVADVGEKSAHTDGQAGRQAECLYPCLFDFDRRF